MSFDDVIRAIAQNISQKEYDHQQVLSERRLKLEQIVKEGEKALDKRRLKSVSINWQGISKKVIKLDEQGVSHTEIANQMRYETGQFITQYDISQFIYKRKNQV